MIKRYFQNWLTRLDAVGFSSLGIFISSGVFYFAYLQSLQLHLVELKAAAYVEAPRVEVSYAEPAISLDKQLQTFCQYFPHPRSLSGQVDALFDAAKKHNLGLETGQYEVIRGDTRRLTRCEVQLPLKGSYKQTRAFIANVLQEMPNAALSNIGIQRPTIGDSIVESQIRLTLYYRET